MDLFSVLSKMGDAMPIIDQAVSSATIDLNRIADALERIADMMAEDRGLTPTLQDAIAMAEDSGDDSLEPIERMEVDRG